MKETVRETTAINEVVKAELSMEIKDELRGSNKPIGVLHIERTIEIHTQTEQTYTKDH